MLHFIFFLVYSYLNIVFCTLNVNYEIHLKCVVKMVVNKSIIPQNPILIYTNIRKKNIEIKSY